MGALDYQSLNDLSRKWQHQALELDFLGEIAVGQSEIDTLLPQIGKFHSRIDEPDLAFAFAVAAVNWAYWRGVEVDEAQGFRESFLTHAIGRRDDRLWDGSWGPAIETAICEWSKRPHRVGTYRYVGLILRHAGVPHAKIPKLAELLRSIDLDIGWSNLLLAKDFEIQNHVVAHFGNGIIGEHLQSTGGISYIRSLCSDLERLSASSVGTAGDYPGYRPGLLAALLGHLPHGRSTSSIKPFRWPYIVLDVSSGHLELIFDENLVRRRDAICCDQWPRRVYDTRLDIGPGGVEPTSEYTGRFPDGRRWSIAGWRYTEPSAWAIFRSDGRFVASQNQCDPVPSGDYLLVTVSKSNLADQWPSALDDGERQLPDGTECRVWHVELAEGDDAKLPGLRVTSSGYPWIECANAGSLTRWTTFDAVCDSPPEIKVGGWNGRVGRRFRLTLTTPLGQRDLQPSERGGLPATVNLADLPIGQPAEVTLTPIGYQHGSRAAQSLRVVRFPGSLRFENAFWPSGTEATLRVDVSPGLALKGIGLTSVTQAGHTCYLTTCQSWATVSAEANGVSLDVRLPVPRVSFAFTDSPGEPAIFDYRFLRDMRHADGTAATFTISATPHSEIDLSVIDGFGNRREWRRGLKVGSNGRLDLHANDIVDIARGEAGILQVLVKCGLSEIETGAYFVQPNPRDIELESTSPLIAAYLGILKAPLGSLDALSLLQQVRFLHQYACIVAATDAALELATIGPASTVSPPSSDWVDELRELLATRPTSIGAHALPWKEKMREWLRRAPIPFVPRRWEAKIQSIFEELDRTVDISIPLAHLLAGQPDQSVPDGIRHGWKRYREALADPHARVARLIQANDFLKTATHSTPPWSAIAHRLSAWTMLRAGAVSEFCQSIAWSSESTECPELDEQLNAVARLLGAPKELCRTSLVGGLHHSCVEEDRLLATALSGEGKDWRAAAQRCWLAAWLGWRQFHADVSARDLCKELLALANQRLDDAPSRVIEAMAIELRTQSPQPHFLG